MKNFQLLYAVIFGLMVTGVQAADTEFKNECAMGLAMKKHIPTECSVMWKSENGKTYCFGDQTAKEEFLKDDGRQSREGGGLLVAAGGALIRARGYPMLSPALGVRSLNAL